MQDKSRTEVNIGDLVIFNNYNTLSYGVVLSENSVFTGYTTKLLQIEDTYKARMTVDEVKILRNISAKYKEEVIAKALEEEERNKAKAAFSKGDVGEMNNYYIIHLGKVMLNTPKLEKVSLPGKFGFNNQKGYQKTGEEMSIDGNLYLEIIKEPVSNCVPSFDPKKKLVTAARDITEKIEKNEEFSIDVQKLILDGAMLYCNRILPTGQMVAKPHSMAINFYFSKNSKAIDSIVSKNKVSILQEITEIPSKFHYGWRSAYSLDFTTKIKYKNI